MWRGLDEIDWAAMGHAYGSAADAPGMLRALVDPDEEVRNSGWSGIWGALNHQGDFYDSTVATIPFLIEAVAAADTPDRTRILGYLATRWLDGIHYGDPQAPEPPGGEDPPTPLLSERVDAPPGTGDAGRDDDPGDEDEDDEDDFDEHDDDVDPDSYRRMDLCSWQVGRAIRAGIPTYRALLDDPDRAVASAAAILLLPWPETRRAAKDALWNLATTAADPQERAVALLELGVYGEPSDRERLAAELGADRPAPVRAAAALVDAWITAPERPSPGTVGVLRELSEPGDRTFAVLPHVGVYAVGPWGLPPDGGDLLLRLAVNNDRELRWRAIQGFSGRHTWAISAASVPDPERAVPVLLDALDDPNNRIRGAAADVLATLGATLIEVAPDVSDHLQRRLRELIDPLPQLDLAALLEIEAYPEAHHNAVTAAEADRRLADWFLTDPDGVLAEITGLVDGDGSDRSARGAAQWAAAIGPVAGGLLDAVTARAGRGDQTNLAGADRVARLLLDRPSRAAADHDRPETAQAGQDRPEAATAATDQDRPEAGAAGLAGRLSDPDPLVRADAARECADAAADPGADVVSLLVGLLEDEASVELGLDGRFRHGGRLVLWRIERRSPRAEACRALVALDRVPDGDHLLRALVAETLQPSTLSLAGIDPTRFDPSSWEASVAASGDPAGADAVIRRARMTALDTTGEHAQVAYVGADELAAVLHHLSGRLIP